MCITNGKKQSEAQRSKPKTIGGMYEGYRSRCVLQIQIGEMRSRLTDTVATDLMSWLIARREYVMRRTATYTQNAKSASSYLEREEKERPHRNRTCC